MSQDWSRLDARCKKSSEVSRTIHLPLALTPQILRLLPRRQGPLLPIQSRALSERYPSQNGKGSCGTVDFRNEAAERNFSIPKRTHLPSTHQQLSFPMWIVCRVTHPFQSNIWCNQASQAEVREAFWVLPPCPWASWRAAPVVQWYNQCRPT